jgi:hypothetical protein
VVTEEEHMASVREFLKYAPEAKIGDFEREREESAKVVRGYGLFVAFASGIAVLAQVLHSLGVW